MKLGIQKISIIKILGEIDQNITLRKIWEVVLVEVLVKWTQRALGATGTRPYCMSSSNACNFLPQSALARFFRSKLNQNCHINGDMGSNFYIVIDGIFKHRT